MTSSVTVGIPFYSSSKPEQLQAAVDSILNQSLRPDEVHLIQDGSVSEEMSQLIQTYVEHCSNAGLFHSREID